MRKVYLWSLEDLDRHSRQLDINQKFFSDARCSVSFVAEEEWSPLSCELMMSVIECITHVDFRRFRKSSEILVETWKVFIEPEIHSKCWRGLWRTQSVNYRVSDCKVLCSSYDDFPCTRSIRISLELRWWFTFYRILWNSRKLPIRLRSLQLCNSVDLIPFPQRTRRQ